MGDLTKNFSASEFDVPEPIPSALRKNIPDLAIRAQWLRDCAGVPGHVNDTYRSPAHTAAIPGANPNGQHPKAEASDITFALVPIRTLAERALASIANGTAPAFGQLIFYNVKGHAHISLPTLGARNGEVLVCTGADANGRDLFERLTDPATQMPLWSTAQKKTARSSAPSSSHASPRCSGGEHVTGEHANGAN